MGLFQRLLDKRKQVSKIKREQAKLQPKKPPSLLVSTKTAIKRIVTKFFKPTSKPTTNVKVARAVSNHNIYTPANTRAHTEYKLRKQIAKQQLEIQTLKKAQYVKPKDTVKAQIQAEIKKARNRYARSPQNFTAISRELRTESVNTWLDKPEFLDKHYGFTAGGKLADMTPEERLNALAEIREWNAQFKTGRSRVNFLVKNMVGRYIDSFERDQNIDRLEASLNNLHQGIQNNGIKSAEAKQMIKDALPDVVSADTKTVLLELLESL